MAEKSLPLSSLAQRREDMVRFQAVVDDQRRRDAEHRKQLEEELLLTRRRLAAVEDELRYHRQRIPSPSRGEAASDKSVTPRLGIVSSVFICKVSS